MEGICTTDILLALQYNPGDGQYWCGTAEHPVRLAVGRAADSCTQLGPVTPFFFLTQLRPGDHCNKQSACTACKLVCNMNVCVHACRAPGCTAQSEAAHSSHPAAVSQSVTHDTHTVTPSGMYSITNHVCVTQAEASTTCVACLMAEHPRTPARAPCVHHTAADLHPNPNPQPVLTDSALRRSGCCCPPPPSERCCLSKRRSQPQHTTRQC